MGLSQRAVAQAAGIGLSVPHYIERSKSGTSVMLVEQLAEALRVSPAWLAYGLGPRTVRRAPAPRSQGLPRRLLQARHKAGLTHRELAERAEVVHMTPYRIELADGYSASLAVVERLAEALQVSPAWLAYGIGPRGLGE